FSARFGEREVAGVRATDLFSGGVVADHEPLPELVDDRLRDRRTVLDHDRLDVRPRLLYDRLQGVPQPRATTDRANQDRDERRIAPRILALRAKRHEGPVAAHFVAPSGEHGTETRRLTHARHHEVRPLPQKTPEGFDEAAAASYEVLRRQHFSGEHRETL